MIVIIRWAVDIFRWLLFARIIFSFIQLNRNTHPLVLTFRRISFSATEPVLAPLRNVIKPVSVGGGAYLDLTPILALLLVPIVANLVIRLLLLF